MPATSHACTAVPQRLLSLPVESANLKAGLKPLVQTLKQSEQWKTEGFPAGREHCGLFISWGVRLAERWGSCGLWEGKAMTEASPQLKVIPAQVIFSV